MCLLYPRTCICISTVRITLAHTHTHSELEDLPMGSFEVNISRLDDAFTRDLVGLLDKLYEFRGQTVGGMVSRLDFNGFYQGRMTSRDIT